VYTPESGLNLPGISFGHEWLTTAERYQGTLEHLASWGIVAAAPNTETGLAPSAPRLAFDLNTTLDIIASVRLGPGKISVHPQKLGLVGHGFGGGAAVLAAAERPGNSRSVPHTVVALFPAVTKPPAENPAAALTIPGLVLALPGDPYTLRSNAVELARAWDGAVLRTVSGAKAGGLIEGRRLARAVGLPGADRTTQKTVRALLTGFLLYQLAGDKAYREFADPRAQLPKTEPVGTDADPVKVEDKIVALLKP
jgi:dienelactone hydrolase